MADQLLNMALLKQDDMEKEDCFVAVLFEQSRKVMQVKAEEKRIRLSYVVSRNFLIRGNMEQLVILRNNLIDNGIKASRPEGEIRISACFKESNALVHRCINYRAIGTCLLHQYCVVPKGHDIVSQRCHRRVCPSEARVSPSSSALS